MITFLWIAALAIFVVAAMGIAYSASQRKRSGQSNQAEVNSQKNQDSTPKVGRATGLN
ncbi:MAG: hypothetical protein ACRYFU_12255 [Janthinobacterium lividum]